MQPQKSYRPFTFTKRTLKSQLVFFLAMAWAALPGGWMSAAPALQSETGTPASLPGDSPAGTPLPIPTGAASETPPAEMSQVVVRYQADQTAQAFTALPGEWQAHTPPELARLGVVILNIPADQAQSILAQLSSDPAVMYAEPNNLVQALETIPNDPGWVNQYNMTAIHAQQGWDIATGSAAVTIAIVDSGVDLSHPDLAGKLLPGYDFVNNDAIPQDDFGHGTHAAGIAAALTNNGLDVAGVSWGARILPVKVLNSGGGGTYANVAAGIIWAVDNGAQVINLSLGGSAPSSVLADAVDYAASRGALLVAAAGNSGAGSVLYPAAYPAVLAVAATDAANQRAGFSNFGPDIDLAAPGVSIYSLNIGGGTIYRSGTSMAAPHVAGLAAILMGLPGGNAWSARAWMESTALDIDTPGWDVFTGYGLIQVDAALQAVPGPTATATDLPPLVATATPTRLKGSDIVIPAPSATAYPTQTGLPTANPNLSVTPLPPSVTVTALPFSTAQEVSSQSQPPGGMDDAPGLLLCGGALLVMGGILLLAALRRAIRPAAS